MFIPLGTDRPLKRPTRATHALLCVTVAAFIAQLLAQRDGDMGLEALARFVLVPTDLKPWAFFSYQFLHGDLVHLLGNLLFLWVFGPNVEDRFGRIGFVAFYLVGGAAAGAVHCVSTNAPVIGASGAISAATGAYLVLFPRTTIRVLVWFFIIGMWRIPATWFIGFAIAKDVYFSLRGGGGEVAFGAHLGGYAFGAALAMGLLWTRLLDREAYDLFSIARQANRRRVFRAATKSGGPWGADASRVRTDAAARPSKPASARDEQRAAAVASARAEIVRLLAANDAPAAAARYRAALDELGRFALPRDKQLDLANRLYALGDADAAAVAYDVFLEQHPRDAESARVRLMLGLIHGRQLNDPVRAKSLLRDALERLDTEQERALAQEALNELG